MSFIWEMDFMEDMSAVLLDGVHLHWMGRKLPGLFTENTKQLHTFILHLTNS